jgi:uncharacterized protein YbjT (DUF2867 family)
MNLIRLTQITACCCLLLEASAFVSNVRPSFVASNSHSALDAYKKVFVAGASRGVGRIVLEKLIAQGSEVVALVRDEAVAKELNAIDGVTAKLGDAFDQKGLEDIMYGCDAAITTLGGSTSDTDQRVDYVGNNNVIESAGILGVVRIILVTSIGCGNSKEAAPPKVFDVLKDVLAAKERAENVLIKYYTNSNWTIIRPGGLTSDGSASGKAILTADNMAIGSIHREDVASLVLAALDSAATERKILSAVDPTMSEGITSLEPFVL